MRAWGPEMDGSPVVRGPPPLGPWDDSRVFPGGGFRPKLQGRIPVTSVCRPFGFASKLMSILISIFGRFGVDLGSLLGVIFAHLGALVGLSWSQNRLRTVLSSKK